MNRLKEIMLLIALLPAIALEAQAGGFDYRDIEIDVVSDNRGTLREYPVDAAGRKQRHYIAVRNGERYGVRVRNNSGERIGVVIAVDGRNIINGRKSRLKHDEAMYVLGPWESRKFANPSFIAIWYRLAGVNLA